MAHQKTQFQFRENRNGVSRIKQYDKSGTSVLAFSIIIAFKITKTIGRGVL